MPAVHSGACPQISGHDACFRNISWNSFQFTPVQFPEIPDYSFENAYFFTSV